MYKIEKMNKKLLASQVEEELLNYIIHEPVEIGARIPNEFELAERFGVAGARSGRRSGAWPQKGYWRSAEAPAPM